MMDSPRFVGKSRSDFADLKDLVTKPAEVQEKYVILNPPGWEHLAKVRDRNRSLALGSLRPVGAWAMYRRFTEAPVHLILQASFWNRSIYRFEVHRVEGAVKIQGIARIEEVKALTTIIEPQNEFKFYVEVRLAEQTTFNMVKDALESQEEFEWDLYDLKVVLFAPDDDEVADFEWRLSVDKVRISTGAKK